MKKIVIALIALLIGIVIGCCWNFYRYQPFKLAQENKPFELVWENKKLREEIKGLNSAWVKEFSKKHGLIEVEE